MFENGLPQTSAELIELLDKAIPPVTVTSPTEAMNHVDLLWSGGRRSLVEQLLFQLKRQREGK